jgi:hypothetical protein
MEIYRKPPLWRQKPWFPVDVPLNQFIETHLASLFAVRGIRSPLAFPRLVHHHSQRAALTLPPVALPKGSGAQEGSEALLLGGHQSLVDLLHLGR